VRKILGSVVGIVVAFAIMIGVDLGAMQLHAPPTGIAPGPEATAAWLANAPVVALAIIVLAWFLAALGGGYAAIRTARWPAAAWVVAAIVLISAVMGALRPPHPLWMQVGAVVAPLLGAWLAIRLPRAAPTATPDAA